jgi:hypothetical protein
MFKGTRTFDDKGIDGIGAEGDPYYGPPVAGQDYASFNSFMQMPIVSSIGIGIATAMIINPVIGIAAGAAWFLGKSGSGKNKPTSQGG